MSEENREQVAPINASEQSLLSRLGGMIQEFYEEDYTATVKFRGKKVCRGFSISTIEIVGQQKENQMVSK